MVFPIRNRLFELVGKINFNKLNNIGLLLRFFLDRILAAKMTQIGSIDKYHQRNPPNTDI